VSSSDGPPSSSQGKHIFVATVRRAEIADHEPSITVANAAAIRQTLEEAGVELTNGDAPGVKLRKGP